MNEVGKVLCRSIGLRWLHMFKTKSSLVEISVQTQALVETSAGKDRECFYFLLFCKSALARAYFAFVIRK